MTEYADFRKHLDTILRTLDVKQVSAFLIQEGQWDEGTPANPEFAMWMMIAASSNLRDLHGEARKWLVQHGYEGEASAVLDREKGGNKRSGSQSGNGKGRTPQGNRGGKPQNQQRGSQGQNRSQSQMHTSQGGSQRQGQDTQRGALRPERRDNRGSL